MNAKLESQLKSDLRTDGADPKVVRGLPVIIIQVDVPHVDSVVARDAFVGIYRTLVEYPTATDIQVTFLTNLDDGTVDGLSYRWSEKNARVDVGRFRQAYRNAPGGGQGVGFVDGMTPAALARIVGGGNAPAIAPYPEPAP